MKIFYLAAISVIQLCTSSRGGSNRESSRHMNRSSTAELGPSHDGYENTSRSTSLLEGEQLLLECLGDSTKDIYCSGEQNFDYGSCLEDFTEYAGEDDPQPIPHCDVNPPFAEHGQSDANENNLQTYSSYFEEDFECLGSIRDLLMDIEPSIPQDLLFYDPSYIPVFTSPQSTLTDFSGSSVCESYAGSSRDKKRNQNNDVEHHPPAYQGMKRNGISKNSTHIEDGELLEALSKAESQVPQEDGGKELTGQRKRRYGRFECGESGSSIRKADSDMTEIGPSKRSKTVKKFKPARYGVNAKSYYRALKAENKRFENDVRSGKEYNEWKNEQYTKARKQNKQPGEIYILLKVLDGLFLIKGQNPFKSGKIALVKSSQSLETGERQIQEEIGQGDMYCDSWSDTSLFLVEFSSKKKCEQNKILYSDLRKVVNSNMRIHFFTKIFFTVFKSGRSYHICHLKDYKNIREAVGKYALPIGSAARKKYSYLRNALAEAGIKSIEVRVVVKHTLHLGTTGGEDSLELAKPPRDLAGYTESVEDLIIFTGVTRVVYLINENDIPELSLDIDCTQHEEQSGSEYKQKTAKRKYKHKAIGKWIEEQSKKLENGGKKCKTEYYIVIQKRFCRPKNITEEDYRNLLVQHSIISNDSNVKVRMESNFFTDFGIKFARRRG